MSAMSIGMSHVTTAQRRCRTATHSQHRIGNILITSTIWIGRSRNIHDNVSIRIVLAVGAFFSFLSPFLSACVSLSSYLRAAMLAFVS